MSIKATPMVGACGIVLNDQNEILLTKRADSGTWCLPGGTMRRGETIEGNVVRRIKEEIGLDVIPVRLAGIYSRPEYSADIEQGPEHHIVKVCFLCELKGGKVALNPEAVTEVTYFKQDELPELFTNHRIMIGNFTRDNSRVVVD